MALEQREKATPLRMGKAVTYVVVTSQKAGKRKKKVEELRCLDFVGSWNYYLLL